MSTETTAAIAELHAWYGQRTGVVTKLFFAQRLWFDLLRSYQFDAAKLKADAEFVIRHLKREIAREKRNLGALKPANFLQPDNFDADLAMASLAARIRPRAAVQPSSRTIGDVTIATETDPAAEAPARPVGEEVARQLRKFREQLAGPQSPENHPV